ncbi:MAG: UV DNA damage repair endonuclease UvsE [Verrucomicrobia bacterium]|nr:UV DNA damage repair endonuclease UvsE [Verrucomicrobiota bacterium]MBV9658312.1 UV DNA damage repair endonuclease UvsE [Verrucomicrobiota bacterium]
MKKRAAAADASQQQPPTSAVATAAPARLGFAVLVLGQAGLKSADLRRWQNAPHLRVSLEYLRAIFDYLQRHAIRMYRMSSDVAPYITHPDLPQFHRQVEECAQELADLGAVAREQGLRLSFHPSQYIILNSPNPEVNRKGALDVDRQAAMLDAMDAGPDAVVVIHVGGRYDDPAAARDRWIHTYEHVLSEPARRRLVLENDDVSFSAADVLYIHERCGVPLVFDHQHFCCLNPARLELVETAVRFLRTWPAQRRPKLHFSSPRTQLREVQRRNRQTKKLETAFLPPVWTGHADYCDPFVFIQFMRQLSAANARDFDAMLEAKAKDLALLRLRTDLTRYAPDVAARFGLTNHEAAAASEEPAEAVT